LTYNSAKSIYDVPDIIIVCRRAKKSCTYYRFKASEIYNNQNAAYEVYQMKIDKSTTDNLEEHQTGYLRVRAGVFDNGPPSTWQSPNRNPSLEKICVVVNLFSARNLPSADPNGLADPEVVCYHYGSLGRSKVIRNCIDPMWCQRLVINSYAVDGWMYPVVLNVYDMDETISKTEWEFLGVTLVSIGEENRATEANVNNIPPPKWYELLGKEGRKMGRVSLSVQILPQLSARPRDIIQPIVNKKDKFRLKLYLLGLRNLQSNGPFDIKAPFIKLNLGSLREGYSSNFSDSLTAKAIQGGRDPNFNNLISLEVTLPVNLNIMPVLTCHVYDVALTGLLGDNYIGAFTIDLTKYAIATKIFFITRLVRLLNYLKARNVQDRYQRPIKLIIGQMKEYLTSDDAMIVNDLTDAKEFARKKKEMNEVLQKIAQVQMEDAILQGTVEQSNVQSYIKQSVFQEEFKPKDKIKAIVVPIDLQREGQEKKKMLEESMVPFSKQPPPDKRLPVVVLADYELNTKGEVDLTREKKGPTGPYKLLGFDNLGHTDNKHYRLMLNEELEKTVYVSAGTFEKASVFRGTQMSHRAWGEEPFREVGIFRGEVKLIEERFLSDIENLGLAKECKKLQLPTNVSDWEYSFMDYNLLNSKSVIIRVYLVDAEIYIDTDINSAPDPYVNIELGKTKISGRDQGISDTNKPNFYQCIELKHTLPGPAILKVQLYDKDPLIGDDLIGVTEIDIEARYFDEKFMALENYPIEKREIKKPETDIPTGAIRMWTEIIIDEKPTTAIDQSQHTNASKALNDSASNSRGNIEKLSYSRKKWTIEMMPPGGFELRVVIWEVHDIPIDDPEGLSDLYVTVSMPSYNPELLYKTDTHIRSEGFGSFNWRILVPIESEKSVEKQKYLMEFQVWDKDLLSANDYICSRTLDIWPAIQAAMLTGTKATLADKNNKNEEKLEIELDTKRKLKPKMRPRMFITVDCLTRAEADLLPAGVGRGNPNQNPFLPDPVGRWKFSWNPYTLLLSLVGPDQRRKITCCLICTCIIILIVLILPFFFTNILSRLFMKTAGVQPVQD